MAPGDELGWRQPGLGPCSGQRLRGKAREGHVVAGQAAASDRGGSSHREQCHLGGGTGLSQQVVRRGTRAWRAGAAQPPSAWVAAASKFSTRGGRLRGARRAQSQIPGLWPGVLGGACACVSGGMLGVGAHECACTCVSACVHLRGSGPACVFNRKERSCGQRWALSPLLDLDVGAMWPISHP